MFLAFENTTSTKIKQITAGETLKLRCMGKAENDSADILWSVPEPLNTQERYTISTLKVENINREKWFKRNLNVINIKAIDTGYYTCSHLKKYHSYIPLKAENSTNSPWIKRYYVYAYGKLLTYCETWTYFIDGLGVLYLAELFFE